MVPISSSDSSTMLPQAVIEARSAELPKGAIIGLIFMGVILGLILVAVFLYLCLRYSKWSRVLSSYRDQVEQLNSVADCAFSPAEEFSTFGKSFSGKDNVIASHVSPQEPPPPVDNSTIPCTIEGCTQRFATPSDLNHHMRYHNRPHHCPSCELCFGTITHLKRHINDVHDTTEKYHCSKPSCKYSIDGGKSFSRKDNLKRHMGTHTGVESGSFGSPTGPLSRDGE